ncbi:ATP-binding cassette domain-containing protein [Flagellimonas sediminis]|uniref:ATP-binding cassette domain-containing protein n=1 Tax=Flagellimonas sediminis TaxID=2696468 RepID=A0A6I5KMR7_9FLAO|nr:ATP-binding cassette domain-containing protein [Allomuricauda sediminis]NDV41986.1 ATP-binding cassette domain-containing protein [Allomuricauda sediminis]
MIRIENLSKSFGQKKVLDCIDIEFNNGKVYGIVGENGVGKTTLFRCISGLETYEGNISSDVDNLKDTLGFLATEPFFFSKITGKEYIRFLVNARQVKLTNIEDKNIFDLPLNQYISTYSTGMKKKLALTAILLQENKVFVLDEPFNGVDIQSNLLITEIIKKLRELGKTAIISSHIFSTLAETCDEIFLMKSGRILKKVDRKDFADLEAEMKEFSIGNQIAKLELK